MKLGFLQAQLRVFQLRSGTATSRKCSSWLLSDRKLACNRRWTKLRVSTPGQFSKTALGWNVGTVFLITPILGVHLLSFCSLHTLSPENTKMLDSPFLLSGHLPWIQIPPYHILSVTQQPLNSRAMADGARPLVYCESPYKKALDSPSCPLLRYHLH